MVAELLKQLKTRPFVAFNIVTMDGKIHRVASADHAHFTEGKTRIVVMFDDETTATIPVLGVASLLPTQCP